MPTCTPLGTERGCWSTGLGVGRQRRYVKVPVLQTLGDQQPGQTLPNKVGTSGISCIGATAPDGPTSVALPRGGNTERQLRPLVSQAWTSLRGILGLH